VKSTVEALEGNKVKLSVEVDEAEFETAVDAAFRRIAQEVRIPGFRPGKVPRKILEARMGTEAARQEALRDALPDYYARAVDAHDVDVIAPPEIDITGGAADGNVSFDAVVEVRPKIKVAGYDGLRVEIPAPTVSDEEITEQVDRLRRQSGTLAEVERSAAAGDYVTVDIVGSVHGEPQDSLTVDDYLYEVGSGMVVPELDDNLEDASAGDELLFDAEHPDPDEEHPISFRVVVKQVQEQVLPEADDEWAADASEFDTIDELRADLHQRLDSLKRVQARLALRDGVVESLTKLVDDEPPTALVDGEIERRLQDLAHRLSHQGATIQQYVEATGQSPQDLLDQLREQALPAVNADLALRAVIDAEGITADDDEIEAEIERLAQQMEDTPANVREQLERAGRMSAVRSDVQRSKALEWLLEHAEVVDPDGNPIDRSLLEPPSGADEEGSTDTEQEQA
jgi:trigger factor